MTKTRQRIKYGTAAAILAIATVGAFEGYSPKAYKDIVGIPTICYGETKGVKMGQSHTKLECDQMLLDRLGEFERGVVACNHYPMNDWQLVANVSLAYNIGLGAYCKSTVVRLFNAGKAKEACNAFLMWNKAGGRVVSGLVKRRQEERKLCLWE